MKGGYQFVESDYWYRCVSRTHVNTTLPPWGFAARSVGWVGGEGGKINQAKLVELLSNFRPADFKPV